MENQKAVIEEMWEVFKDTWKWFDDQYKDWGGLHALVQQGRKEEHPEEKRFDVLIDAQATLTLPVWAKDREEAEREGWNYISEKDFWREYREGCTFTEATVGDVIE